MTTCFKLLIQILGAAELINAELHEAFLQTTLSDRGGFGKLPGANPGEK